MPVQHLEYATAKPNSSRVLLIAVPYLALVSSIAVAVVALNRMDADRLLWEGGHQYFRANFPFRTVIGLALLGVVSGTPCVIVVRRGRLITVVGICCNALWGMWWARHLLR